MAVFCGVDWAEGHHDIALIDNEGKLVAQRRINESVEGVAELTAMLTAAGDSAEEPIPVAIETPRGLLVAVLRASGRPIYPINPLAVARYRERTSVSGKKSDHVDAMALANILRTDAHLHRLLPDDSPLVRSIMVLARAYQDAVCDAPSWCRSYVPGCVSTTPASWTRSLLAPVPGEGCRVRNWPARMPARCWRSPPVPRRACGFPRPGWKPRCAAAAGSVASPAWPPAW